jgi:acyl-CoA synthetase (AMP-forming)/AMP-acid ligase II/acyl carrier protein
MTLAIAYGDEAPTPPYASLPAALRGAIEKFPAGRFCHVARSGEFRERPYREVLAAAERLAAALRARGLRPGDGLILNLRDGEKFIPALWAAILGGFVAAPLAQNAGLRPGAERRNEIFGFVAAALKSAVILTDDPDFRAPGSLSFDELAQDGDGLRAPLESGNGGGPCLAVLTSGATGRPKLVALNEAAALARWWPRLPAGDDASIFLSWSPFDHIMGLSLAAPNLPCKVHLDAGLFAARPLAWLDAVERARVTHATMTNFGLSLLVEALEAAPRGTWRLDSLRKIGVGAETVSAPLCARFLDLLIPYGLREDSLILGYGMTECGPVAGGDAVFSRDEARMDVVPLDRPAPGHSIRITGEDAEILGEGEAGRIEVRGPTMAAGYIGDQEATAALFTPDGWLRTGDLGFLRDGRLSVTGREKELIVVNAKKYSCQEIESAITARSRFKHVYAVPLDGGGAARAPGQGKPFAIAVAVSRVEDYDLAGVAGEIRRILAAAYRFTPEIVALVGSGEVPRTALGKIQRLKLAEMLAEPRFAAPARALSPAHAEKASARDGIGRAVAEIWADMLKCDAAIPHDADFFVLGGDSVLALQMSFEVEQRFGVHVPVETFAGALTIESLANFLSSQSAAARAGTDEAGLPCWMHSKLLELLADFPGRAVSDGGFLRRAGQAQDGLPVFWCLQSAEEAGELAATVGARRPVFILRSGHMFLDYATPAAQALARRYAGEIKAAFPEGPYVLAGNCQGAIIALAIARQLLAEKREVRLLAIADTVFYDLFGRKPFAAPVALYPAQGSKFNPYRKFRFPDQGMRKFLPAGCRIKVIPSAYSRIMLGAAISALSDDLEEAIAWAGRLPPAPESARGKTYPDWGYSAEIAAPYSELTLDAGQCLRLEVSVRNPGPGDWAPFNESGLALGNHWLTLDGEVLVWSDGRAPLMQTIAAGATTAMSLDVRAPREPGRYLLELDLVEEGVRWFGEKYSLPLHIPVVIVEALPPDKRVASAEEVRVIREKINASPMPRWRKRWASLTLSLAKRAARITR